MGKKKYSKKKSTEEIEPSKQASKTKEVMLSDIPLGKNIVIDSVVTGSIGEFLAHYLSVVCNSENNDEPDRIISLKMAKGLLTQFENEILPYFQNNFQPISYEPKDIFGRTLSKIIEHKNFDLSRIKADLDSLNLGFGEAKKFISENNIATYNEFKNFEEEFRDWFWYWEHLLTYLQQRNHPVLKMDYPSFHYNLKHIKKYINTCLNPHQAISYLNKLIEDTTKLSFSPSSQELINIDEFNYGLNDLLDSVIKREAKKDESLKLIDELKKTYSNDNSDFTQNISKIPAFDDSDSNDILYLEDAVKLTNLSKATLYAKTSKRLIPHYKKGKKIYFKRSELLLWLDTGKRKTVDDFNNDAEIIMNKLKKHS